jgi:5'-nucleotidase
MDIRDLQDLTGTYDDDLYFIGKVNELLEKMARKVIYIDMDGVLANFDKAHREQYNAAENPFPQSRVHFFYNLEEIEGSNHALRELDKIYDVRIATAPSVKNPLCYTEKRQWIGERYGDINLQDRLYIIPDKSALIGDYLIDDWDTGRGQDKFVGELIHFGSKEYKDWNSVLDHFYFLDKMDSK